MDTKPVTPSAEEPALLDTPDDDFGGPENRALLEKKLLMKLDIRMSILVVIYILNYVRLNFALPYGNSRMHGIRSTGITQRQLFLVLSVLRLNPVIQCCSTERIRG